MSELCRLQALVLDLMGRLEAAISQGSAPSSKVQGYKKTIRLAQQKIEALKVDLQTERSSLKELQAKCANDAKAMQTLQAELDTVKAEAKKQLEAEKAARAKAEEKVEELKGQLQDSATHIIAEYKASPAFQVDTQALLSKGAQQCMYRIIEQVEKAYPKFDFDLVPELGVWADAYYRLSSDEEEEEEEGGDAEKDGVAPTAQGADPLPTPMVPAPLQPETPAMDKVEETAPPQLEATNMEGVEEPALQASTSEPQLAKDPALASDVPAPATDSAV